MKIILTIIIYNRLENLKHWLDCWKVCNQENTELRVIHNYNNPKEQKVYNQLCIDNKVTYLT